MEDAYNQQLMTKANDRKATNAALLKFKPIAELFLHETVMFPGEHKVLEMCTLCKEISIP